MTPDVKRKKFGLNWKRYIRIEKNWEGEDELQKSNTFFLYDFEQMLGKTSMYLRFYSLFFAFFFRVFKICFAVPGSFPMQISKNAKDG